MEGCGIHTAVEGRVRLVGQWPEGVAVRCLVDDEVLPCTVHRLLFGLPVDATDCCMLVVCVPAKPEMQEPRRMLVEVEHMGHLVAAPVLLSPSVEVAKEVAGLEAKLSPEDLSHALVQLGACLEPARPNRLPPTPEMWAQATRMAVRFSMPAVLQRLLQTLQAISKVRAFVSRVLCCGHALLA